MLSQNFKENKTTTLQTCSTNTVLNRTFTLQFLKLIFKMHRKNRGYEIDK